TRLVAGLAAGALVVWRSWAASDLDQNTWAVVGCVVALAAVAVALTVVGDRLPSEGHVPALLGIMQFAIYCCVPETSRVAETVVAVAVLAAIELASHRALSWWVRLAVAA